MLEKFSVIDLVRTRSASVVTISGDAIKFNAATAAELECPAYIQFLVLAKKKQFGIRACKEDDPYAVRFSKNESGKKAVIRVTAPAVGSLIRQMTGWRKEETWNIPGILLADEGGILFDLSTAYPPREPKGGWKARKAATEQTASLEDETA